MRKEDFTIIIQGPLNETSMDNLENYLMYGKVLFSHWATDDVELKERLKLLKKQYSNVESIATLEEPDRIVDYRMHQLVSTKIGVCNTKTKYCIKVRSDEAYGNLLPIINKFLLDDNKLVTHNMFYKPKYGKYHISDHLMIAKTKYFKKGLKRLDEIHKKIAIQACESTFGTCFLMGKYNLDHEKLPNNEKAFNDDFDCIDVNDFDYYILKWNGGPGKRINKVYEKPYGELYIGEE